MAPRAAWVEWVAGWISKKSRSFCCLREAPRLRGFFFFGENWEPSLVRSPIGILPHLRASQPMPFKASAKRDALDPAAMRGFFYARLIAAAELPRITLSSGMFCGKNLKFCRK